MGLVNCSECNAEVSDKAPSCVKCGNPIAAQTIEATGKKWKMMQLVGALLFVFGFFGTCAMLADPMGVDSTSTTAIVLLVAGLCLSLGGRFGAWWHHA